MKTKQCQIENLIIKSFGQIGDDLGDLLYDEEVVMINDFLYKNTKVEIYNDFLTEELDSILAESYTQLLSKVRLALKGYKNLCEDDIPTERYVL